jgi:hypothetical protein
MASAAAKSLRARAALDRTPPRTEIGDADRVALRLRHLLVGEGEQPVLHPALREGMSGGARLRQFVIVVREQ